MVTARCPIEPTELATLERELAPLAMLDEVVRWAFARQTDVKDVVVQDEFSHDVVVPYRDTLHLVFSTT